VTLLQDDDLRLELGRQAREEVLAKYQTATSVDAYRALYRRLSAAKRAGAIVRGATDGLDDRKLTPAEVAR
jgi:hypothetical protein